MSRINAPAERMQFVQSLLDQPAVAWNSNDPESIAPKAAILEKFGQMWLVAADHDAIELLIPRSALQEYRNCADQDEKGADAAGPGTHVLQGLCLNLPLQRK
jgi:hypothetical protein